MNSKKFSFYYFLFALSASFLLSIAYLVFKDAKQFSVAEQRYFYFGPLILNILKSSVNIAWLVLTSIGFYISNYIKKDKNIQILNWFLILSPFAIIFFYNLLFNPNVPASQSVLLLPDTSNLPIIHQ